MTTPSYTTAIPAIDLYLWIPRCQWLCLLEGLNGEEKDYFVEIIHTYTDRIRRMPSTYEQDGKGDEAMAYLHYFVGGCDWWILEKDHDPDGDGQAQLFGYACLGDPQNAELGYIALHELRMSNAELDLHWTPQTLGAIKERLR